MIKTMESHGIHFWTLQVQSARLPLQRHHENMQGYAALVQGARQMASVGPLDFLLGSGGDILVFSRKFQRPRIAEVQEVYLEFLRRFADAKAQKKGNQSRFGFWSRYLSIHGILQA